MSLDTSAIGQVAAELMEYLADEYGPDATVGTVAVVVEVDLPDETFISYRCSDARRWVHAGFFDAAKRAVIESQETSGED